MSFFLSVTPAYLQEKLNHAKFYELRRLTNSVEWLDLLKAELKSSGIELDERVRLSFSPHAILKAETAVIARAEIALSDIKADKKARPQLSLERQWSSLSAQSARIDEFVTKIEYLRYDIEAEFGAIGRVAVSQANRVWAASHGLDQSKDESFELIFEQELENEDEPY